MSRKILWFGLAASAALHAWLIWPRPRPAPPADVQSPPMPKAVVAVRPLPPEQPLPAEPEPESRDAVPPPERTAAAAPEPPVPSPAPVLAEAPIESPPPPPQSPEPLSVPAAAALEPVPDSGPAPLHAAEPEQEAVIEGGGEAPAPAQPASDAMAQRVSEFEEALRELREQAPRPADLADPAPTAPQALAESIAAPGAPVPEAPRTPAIRSVTVPAPIPPRAPRPLALPWLSRTSATGAEARASVPDRATAQPLAAPRPSPSVEPRSRAEAPATAVLRAPQPYRPISTSGRPVRARAEATLAAPSPLAPGTVQPGRPADRGVRKADAAPRRPSDPVARIAWGEPTEALRAIEQGRMLLVRVNDALEIVGGLERSGGSWRRTAGMPSLAAYSNRVRVVDHVGAFAEPALLCGQGEHLAVVVPVGLERRFDRAMRDAAARAGMLWSGVAACYGRLVPTSTGIEFVIDRVEPRAAP